MSVIISARFMRRSPQRGTSRHHGKSGLVGAEERPVRTSHYQFQIVLRQEDRTRLAPVRAGWILTFVVMIFGACWFEPGELRDGLRGVSGLEMTAWIYLPPLMILTGMAFCRGARRAGLLMVLCAPLLLYGAALTAFRNAWLDPSFSGAAAHRPGNASTREYPLERARGSATGTNVIHSGTAGFITEGQ
jgi:hypothetical protein